MWFRPANIKVVSRHDDRLSRRSLGREQMPTHIVNALLVSFRSEEDLKRELDLPLRSCSPNQEASRPALNLGRR